MIVKKLFSMALVTLLMLSMATIFVIHPVFAAEPYIAFSPAHTVFMTPTVNATFSIQINISSTKPFSGYEILFYWNRTYFNATSYTAYAAPVWTSPFFAGSGINNAFNASHGRFHRSCGDVPDPPPAHNYTGYLKAVVINFKIIKVPKALFETDALIPLVFSPGDTYLAYTIPGDPDPHMVTPLYRYNGDVFLKALMTAPPAKLYVNPPSILDTDLIPCHNFSIEVNVQNVINLYDWEFKLYYKNDILNGTEVTEGPFLKSAGSTSFQIKAFSDSFNATHGIVWVVCTLLAPPPVSGNGTLAIISFHVEGLGYTILDLTSTSLKVPWGISIPHIVFDGHFNNVLTAHLFVDPPSLINPAMLPPAYFNISIKVANVTNLYAYEFKLGYNTVILNCLGIIIIPFDNETDFTTEMHIDDSVGLLRLNVTYYPPASPLTTTEPKTLAMVFFQIAAVGSSILDLYDTKLTDPLGTEIPHEASDGYVSILRHDVAVTEVVPSTAETYEGWGVYINVTVMNQGDAAETFTVKAYYDENLIGTIPVNNLAPNATVLLKFNWTTAGVPPCHFYTIKANATIVPYETHITDNEKIDGTVKIRLFADINGDRKVNMLDMMQASNSFGTIPGGPGWDPWADLNRDNKINMFDLVTISINFGKSC